MGETGISLTKMESTKKKINAEGTNRIMVHSLKKTKTGEEYDSYTFINFADPINDARDIDNGIIEVQFGNQIKKFQFPGTFLQGFLELE